MFVVSFQNLDRVDKIAIGNRSYSFVDPFILASDYFIIK